MYSAFWESVGNRTEGTVIEESHGKLDYIKKEERTL